MNHKLSRREILRSSGLAVGSFLSLHLLSEGQKAFSASSFPDNNKETQNLQPTEEQSAAFKTFSPESVSAKVSANISTEEVWQYTPVDPKAVGDLTYALYEQGSCMFATFQAIVRTVGEALKTVNAEMSARCLHFPFYMMKYGEGGMNQTGSLCGALNGSCAAMSLFANNKELRFAMAEELCNFYERTLLPIYVPKENRFPEMPQSISNSILCHISSGKWVGVAKSQVSSPMRSDRCKRLSADVAMKATELLNRYHDKLIVKKESVSFCRVSEPTRTCSDCHGPKLQQPDVYGKMSCSECHDQLPNHHLNVPKGF